LKLYLIEAVAFAVGFVFYALAALSTYTILQFEHSRIDPLSMLFLLGAGGVFSVAVGYACMLGIGGSLSLGVAELICRLTRSRQVLELVGDDTSSSANRILQRTYFLYSSLIIFILSVALGWDIYNADGPKASFLRPFLHLLDPLSKPLKVSPVMYSLELVPVLLVLVTLAGIAPSIALPYFRRFRVAGVNGSPFHTSLLTMVGGVIVGVSAAVTLAGFIYDALWAGRAPIYYHFFVLASVGLSVHFALGTYLARDRSEEMIEARLKRGGSRFVLLGRVDVTPEGGAHRPG
jgi:hypothetical protein